MKKAQEDILSMVLQHAHGDKKDDAKSLLGEVFEKIEGGEMNAEHIASMAPALLNMIKPEHKETIQGLIGEFVKNLGK